MIVFELGGLFSSDWTCPPLTIENASVNRKNPPYSRNTNYTVKCNSGLVLLNDATSTSYKITCDQDLNWVGNTSTWPKCVESKYLQKEGTFPLLEFLSTISLQHSTATRTTFRLSQHTRQGSELSLCTRYVSMMSLVNILSHANCNLAASFVRRS